jgi:hypothetical protein
MPQVSSALLEELQAEIRMESRAAGLRSEPGISSRQIRRRRREIVLAATFVTAGLVALTFSDNAGVLASSAFRAPLIFLGGCFLGYVVDKERHLRRLDELGKEERDLQARSARRVLDQVVYSDVDDGLRKSLMFEDALDALVEGAITFSLASGATLYVLREDDSTSVWTRVGEAPPSVDGSLADRAVEERRPILVDAHGVESNATGERMAVPIVVRDVIVGVVELAARPVRPFDTVDLELVNRFASSAAIALDGSAIYEEAARRVPSSSFAIPVGHAEHPGEKKGRRKGRVEDEYY